MLGQDQDEPSAQSAAMKKHWQDSEYRAKLSEARKKKWQDPEYRAKQNAARQDPEYRNKQSVAVSTTMKKRWQDPEYRAKQSAARQDLEYRAKQNAARQDPEYRNKQSAAVSATMKKRWQNPEYRAKQSAVTAMKKLQNTLGDYVVHIEHGIARFGGIITFSVNGSKQRYLVLVYADGKLYVPTDQIRRIKRYKGGDQPPLSRLNQPLKLRKGIYQRIAGVNQ